MIPFASQRGGGQDLATHLSNAYDNELTETAHLRGSVADDLHGAFKEWEVQAKALTSCKKYLYSLSINPDPAQGPLTRDEYMDYIHRVEDALGLGKQPRAIVFHIKHGREHCHVVWSRIDAEREKAVQLAFDRDKLMRVTRSFARDHGLSLPAGYDKSRQVGQVSLYEKDQERRTGLSKADHMRQVTQAWMESDGPKAFVQALAERGYILATDKRPYVLVDLYGGMNSLPKLIDDKTVRTADLRAFFSADYPIESLPSVKEALKLAAAHRAFVEQSMEEDQKPQRELAALQHAQEIRRRAVEAEQVQLRVQHDRLRRDLQTRQKIERDALRAQHLAKMRATRRQRYANRANGLAAFLGRVTGVTKLWTILRRREDARELAVYREQRVFLKKEQAAERTAVIQRLKVQAREIERKKKALIAIDKREVAALMRDAKAMQRIEARGLHGMAPMPEPSLVSKVGADLHMRGPFQQAAQEPVLEPPGLAIEFARAAGGGEAQHIREGRAVDFNRAADVIERGR